MAEVDVVLCKSCANIWGLQRSSSEKGMCPVCESSDFQRLHAVEI